MSIFARAKQMRQHRKKGFTLVELIVVLVILAILAAILVPALLGYIDKAKEQQVIVEAKEAYTATQALLLEQYAMSGGRMATSLKKKDIKNLTGINDLGIIKVGYAAEDPKDRKSCIITHFSYQKGSVIVHLNPGNSWESGADSKATNTVY